MYFPPLYIGSITVFWGFYTGWPLFSAAAALCFEASFLIRTRFDLKKEDFIRISDLSSVFMIVLLIWSIIKNEPHRIFLSFLSTLPAVFMPLLFAQLYSTSDCVVIGTKAGRRVHSHTPIDIRKLYVFSIVLGMTSISREIDALYIAALFLTVLPPFVMPPLDKLSARSDRNRLAALVLIPLTALVAAIVIGGNYTFNRMMMNWYRDWMAENTNQFKTTTSIGDIGYLKQSNRIEIRLYPETSPELPVYLKQADYNKLINNTWFSRFRRTTQIFPEDDKEWQLFGEGDGSESMGLSVKMKRNGAGVLPLPQGSKRAKNMDVAGVSRGALGAVTVNEGPDILGFEITFDKNERFEIAPNHLDYDIPSGEREVIYNIMEKNSLFGKTDAETLDNIERFFSLGFSYTLLVSGKSGDSYLDDFLNKTKSGHCEYFATATVLMLRSAGIPARYSVGYLIDEYSDIEDAYIARKSDAHAWVTAYIDGEWITVDTTPGTPESYGFLASLTTRVSDIFDLLNMKYENFRRSKSEEINNTLIISATVLILFLMVRVFIRRRHFRQEEDGKKIRKNFGLPDSPIYGILKKFDEKGLPRHENETLRTWAEKNSESIKNINEFMQLIKIHEELRFKDPGDGLLKRELENKAREWVLKSEFD